MASADFSAPVFHHRWRLWPFRAGVEISGNKVQVFPPAGRGFTTLLRLGFGLRLSLQTCPQVGLISAFCSCPPRFASGFLRPRPHGRKFAISSLVPPNWPIGDFHSSPVSCPTYKHKTRPRIADGPSGGSRTYATSSLVLRALPLERQPRNAEEEQQTGRRLRNRRSSEARHLR